MECSVAVADKMRYKVKASVVRSEIYFQNIKASNGSSFNCYCQMCFEVPALKIAITVTFLLPISELE